MAYRVCFVIAGTRYPKAEPWQSSPTPTVDDFDAELPKEYSFHYRTNNVFYFAAWAAVTEV